MDKDKEKEISKAIKKLLKDDKFHFLWNDFEVNGTKFDCVVKCPDEDTIFIVGHSICDRLNEPDSISKKVADAAVVEALDLLDSKIADCKIKFAWANVVPSENNKALLCLHYGVEVVDDSIEVVDNFNKVINGPIDIKPSNEPFEYNNRMVDVFNNLVEHALVLGKSLYWHYTIMEMNSNYLVKSLNEFTNMYKQLNIMSLMFMVKDISVDVEKLDELTRWVISIEKTLDDNSEQD